MPYFLEYNSRGRLFLFVPLKGAIIRGKAIIRGSDCFTYCSLGVVPQIFRFIFPRNQKMITANKLNMSFLRVPNLVPWLFFRAWIVIDQFFWITLHFNLRGRRQKEEKKARGRGDYSREAVILNISVKGGVIIRGRRLIKGRLLLKEMLHPNIFAFHARWK